MESVSNIYNQFDKSVNWNAFIYIFQKIITTTLSFVFFNKLTSRDFSTWANINSIIYLILLWIDFGFKKSVPKYIAYFSKTKESHLRFTWLLIKFQSSILLLATCFLIFYLENVALFLGISLSKDILNLTIVIFFIEACISFIKLLYHSHFWNQYFNLFHSVIILMEAVTNFYIIFYVKSFSLKNIFLAKIFFGLIILIISGFYLFKLYLAKVYNNFSINQENYDTSFFKHSIIMWNNSIFRSLGERNFLVPLLTYYLGAEFSNIFKIANDWALLFQRTILKTIGTTDTSLFSYMNLIEKSLMQNAFNKIISKITRICIPLFGVFIFIILNKSYFIGSNNMIFQAFLLLLLLYIIESFLSPFERMLEVNKNYSVLVLSYLPYLIFPLLILCKQYLPLIGFWYFIYVLYFIKLLNLFVVVYWSNKMYKIKIENLL